ncbi:major facilitator superfamily domain-containing protein [Aspergillus pseudotamarii]|uniref:Major facilitator superfamily domain-containing protein n=1 Tax=Aspergillus pseudotamarii TaxID=132259 RepID=A0A5N6T151_ASPPS|nr:major facilitator superfamily domain-containing protein [Aspergillus pseudotamarii]KAE8139723.1 major facilitator superfamily domain-containing protein [Aspergillus pseudotamarii]
MAATQISDDNPITVTWDGDHDSANPYNWSLAQKWTLTLLAVFTTYITMMNGTIITTAHAAISEEFHVSEDSFPHSYWPVTSWALGGCCSSLFILPLMEDHGVRPIFLSAYLVFICFLVPQAVAQNFATLIVTRFFAGSSVAVLANTSASVIGNIWETEKSRSIPVSLYIFSYLAGSSTGPVIGGAIFEGLSWRWIGYLQLIWFGALLPVYYFLFRESRGAVILARRAQALRKQGKPAFTQLEMEGQTGSAFSRFVQSSTRPLVLVCTESVVLVSTLWSAFTVGTLFLFTQSAEQVFVDLYGWSHTQAGYVQAAIVIGEVLGWLINLFSAKLYFGSASRNTESPGVPIPEARLYLAVVGGVVGITGGMFTYAWTSFPHIPWIAPAIGLAMVGAGSVIVVAGVSDYVVDSYSKYAGSAMGAVATGENLFSALLPLATMSMYTNLGFQWASTTLAFISLVLSLAPTLMFFWGKQIRARSPFIMEAAMSSEHKGAGAV